MDFEKFGPPRRGPSNIQDKMAEFLERIMRDPKRAVRIALIAVAVIVVIIAIATSTYTVDTQENAVILRLGRFYKGAEVGPGLHFKLPFGIDKVYKGKVKKIEKAEFGYRTISAGIDSTYQVEASLMLTGDLNVVNVQWVVRYKIDNLPDYIFNLRDPRAVIRDVSDAIMRQIVGDYSVDEVITVGRESIRTEVRERMQKMLDEYRPGIRIVGVRLQEAKPPKQVRDAFNEVNRSLQEKDRLIQEAEGERNRIIPAARGERERMVLEGEGYKIEKVNNAEGEVAEFSAVLERYLKAKAISRQRMYLETMERILPKAGKKYIIQQKGDVLKLLPMSPFSEGGSR